MEGVVFVVCVGVGLIVNLGIVTSSNYNLMYSLCSNSSYSQSVGCKSMA